MFFTITVVETAVIDLDSFCGYEETLKSILDKLSSLKVVFVSRKKQTSPDFAKNVIVKAPNTETEGTIFQNIIRSAILEVGGVPCKTIFLTASDANLEKATELLIGTVVLKSDSLSEKQYAKALGIGPDFFLESVEHLSPILTGEIAGYCGENLSAPKECGVFPRPTKIYLEYASVPNVEFADCPIAVAGRYFGTNDPRHRFHPYSIRIVQSKMPSGADRQTECFGKVFLRLLNGVVKEDFDFVCCVPSRPSKSCRLSKYLDSIKDQELKLTGELLSKKIIVDLLSCKKDYPDIKKIGASARKKALEGAFTCDENLKGRTIVVIDDVVTSQSTLNEAIRTLLDAGAKKVIPIALAVHPFAMSGLILDESHEIKCGCKSRLVPRTRKSDGVPFYGCGDYGKPGTHNAKDFGVSAKEMLNLVSAKLMQYDEELESDEIDF